MGPPGTRTAAMVTGRGVTTGAVGARGEFRHVSASLEAALPYRTPADDAEFELLVHELVAGYLERCERCQRCPTADDWIAHRKTCWSCENAIRIATEHWGEPCPIYLERLQHVQTCLSCAGGCRALELAIGDLLDWKRKRELQSLACYLRARQDLDDWRTAA